jgi:hypothetical protein
MHKKLMSKHKPVRPKNPVVKAMIQSPKRNAGVHRKDMRSKLTMLDKTEEK